MGSKLKEAVDIVVQLKPDQIREEAQAKNEDFFNKVDENMKKIIKEPVNAQVNEKIDKILSRIEKLVNEQLESEVLIRSSNKAKTSHAIVANLSELELKKILIDKMKNNKSIDRSDEQNNLYKALVDTYEADKSLLENYGDTVTIKRCQDNADDDQEPSAGIDRGSKRKRAGKEPESSSKPREKTSTTTSKSTEGSKSHQQSAGQFAPTEVPMHTANDFEDPTHQEFNTGLNGNLPRQEDPRESFDELMDTPLDFSSFMMNRLKVDTLTPELLSGPTFELMKGTCKSLRYPHDMRKLLPLIPNSRGHQVIHFAQFINNDLAYLSGGVSSRTYSTSVTKTKAADYGNIKWIEDLVPSLIWSEVPVSYDKYALWGISHWGRKRQQFYGFAANKESAKDVYSRRRIIAVIKPQIVEWHGYKHLDWITVRRADDKLYSFKEGDFKRLRLQDIEDMLILLVQGKLTNLKVEECIAFSEAYTAYPNPRGFIYQNRDKKNRLMRLDELYKFCDGTLNDVRTALDDRLKVIRIEYLPQRIWRNSDKERAAAMIQKIDKMLKSRRIMRSLERFIGGTYGGDLRQLQRTI
ncbi:hypothetical protein Tco_1390551 [Tanacetum coccineum]